MKIKINENETYEIKVPEVIDGRELFTFKSRIDHILKLVGRDPLMQTAQDKPLTPVKTRNPHAPIEQRPWDQSRENALKFIRCHYFGTDEEKQAYEQISGKPWKDIYKRTSGIKIRWNIKPEDVDMIRWPSVGERKDNDSLEHLKIQNETETNTEKTDN